LYAVTTLARLFFFVTEDFAPEVRFHSARTRASQPKHEADDEQDGDKVADEDIYHFQASSMM
jgi:hypothetical protein